MPIQVTLLERLNTCADCAYPVKNGKIYKCNDGKREVNLTDIACEYFKCKCCGVVRKELQNGRGV